MKSLVDYRREGAVAIVAIDNPPVNAIGIGVPEGIRDGIMRGIDDPEVEAIIVMGAGSTFIAGADIRQLDQLMNPAAFSLSDLLTLLESCAKPVIAAIHGTALGGGLETALGCHFRCAVSSAKAGLPEVLLGLLPGAGGTQRLSRLIGVEPALELILSGRHIDAQKALSLGLFDEILEGEFLPAALAFARRVVAEKRPLRVISRLPALLVSGSASTYFAGVRAELEQKAQGQLAPFMIVDCVEASVNFDFADGSAFEHKMFKRCAASTQSKAMIEQFFAARKNKGKTDLEEA